MASQADDKRSPRRAGGITRTVNAGFAHHQAGRLDRAEALYRKALVKDPEHAEALHLLGVIAYQCGKIGPAIELIERALPQLHDLPEAHLNLGNALREAGRLAEAVDSYRRAIALEPDYGMAHCNLARALIDQGRFEAGLGYSRRAIELLPDFLGAQINCAVALMRLERFTEAEAPLRRAVELEPDYPDAYYNLGVTLDALGRPGEAVLSYRRALALRPDVASLHFNLGNALRAQNRLDEAVASYRRALALSPDFAEAHNNLGTALQAQNRLDEAVASYRRTLALKPDLAEAHVNLGAVLKDLGKLEEAIASCQNALALAPGLAEAHNNLGTALQEQNRLDDAAASYRRALALDPDLAGAHRNLGFALSLQGKLNEAIASFARAVAFEPDDAGASAAWFRHKMHLCDWPGYREGEASVRKAVERQPTLGAAFTLLTLSSTPAEQLACARRVAAKITVPAAAMLPRRQPRPGERIRLGYLSADFHTHATAFLIAGLIERHDRRGFEIVGYSCGPDDGSATRARLRAAFDRFVDIADMPHRDAARRIHADAIDILVDLKGFTSGARPAILADRPAPIQVNYLGYPGTMGADFIDYIIVDRFLVPPDRQAFFSERLVHLPDCYQCNDDRRAIAERPPSRAACGLPEQGVVFCSFNNSYKITPEFFDIWMRLLHAVPQSVLWLLDANLWAKANLAREAAARGIAPARLVFGPRLPLPEHLARHRLADLFLDTLPCNAHTTASDALWAGLPVLTCAGDTFAGRVAGSLLRAVGLDELVTTSLDDYEALALQLGHDAERLARLRTRLAQNRTTHPLFDTAGFARNLEGAYRRMWESWRAGRPPAAFSVSPQTAAEQHGPG